MHGLFAQLDGDFQSSEPSVMETKRYFSILVELLLVLRRAKWDYFVEEPNEASTAAPASTSSSEPELLDEGDDRPESWFATLVRLQSAAKWWLGPEVRGPPTPFLCTAVLNTAYAQCRYVLFLFMF
jgi:hypothetical protein